MRYARSQFTLPCCFLRCINIINFFNNMDSHTFSEPFLLENSDSVMLTWQVQVLRREQVVDVLHVNATNFPPRFNKKKKNKVVWQLPLTPDQLPRFGEKEKKRLWDMFKQNKKDRRKKVIGEPVSSNVDDTTGTRDQSLQDDSTCNDLYDYEEVTDSYENDKVVQKEKDENPPISSSQRFNNTSLPPAPPPGFSVSDVSLSPDSAIPITPDVRLGSGQMHPISLTDRIEGPIAFPTGPSPSSLFTVEPPLQSCPRHLSKSPPDTTTTSLGAHIATMFIQAITKKVTLDQWLSIYLEQAPSTLMVGQAQAVCATRVERCQQWSALQQPFWECQGWTMQHCGPLRTMLLVVTGRTMQPTGTFCYNLTLMLTHQYQIQNSILSFSLLG